MPTNAADAEHQADALRADLSDTLDSLKGNLRPAALAAEVIGTTQDHTPDWLLRYWALARSPIGLALIGVAAAGIAGGIVTKRQGRW